MFHLLYSSSHQYTGNKADKLQMHKEYTENADFGRDARERLVRTKCVLVFSGVKILLIG